MITENNITNKDEFEIRLKDEAYSYFVKKSHNLNEYLYLCVDNLLRVEGLDFRDFDRIKEYFLNIFFKYVMENPDTVDIHKLYERSVLKKINNLKYWLSLSDEAKEQKAKDLIVPEVGRNSFFFIDTALINSNHSFVLSDFCQDEIEIIDETDEYELFPELAHLSCQELVICIVKLIIKHDRLKEKYAEDLLLQLKEIAVEFIEKKEAKQLHRAKTLYSSINAQRLLTQLRKNKRTKMSSQQWVKMKDLPDRVMDIFLHSRLGRNKRWLMNLPKNEQSLNLKISIANKFCDDGISVFLKEIDRLIKSPIGSEEMKKSTEHVRELVARLSSFNKNEIKILNSYHLKSFKLRKDLSPSDCKLFCNISKNRYLAFGNRYTESADPRKDRTISSLSVNMRDIGVTAARTRNLLKVMYDHSEPDLSSINLKRKHNHDFFLSIEPRITQFFEKAKKLKINKKGINTFVDCLRNQIGGAQGNIEHAYNNIEVLTLLLSDPKSLENPFKNLKELHFILSDKSHLKPEFLSILNHDNFKCSSVDDIFKYAVGNIALEQMLNHCRVLSKAKIKRYKHEAPSTVTKMQGNGFTVEVLPYNEPLGFIGASLKGVCIHHGDKNHQQHFAPVFSNLIVRDNDRVLLWGLLVRVQNIESDTYFLNNLQGSLSGALSRKKAEVSELIRKTLSTLGDTLTYPFFFNSISIVEQDQFELYKGAIHLPSARLDVSSTYVPDKSLYGESYVICDAESLYFIPKEKTAT